MSSNVTLKSNVYINKTGSCKDQEFLQHITDYRVLKKFNGYNPLGRSGEVWMTETQRAILEQGQPKCSLEKGTMSWGVPVGDDRFVCRCEEYTCPRYVKCSKGTNFEAIERVASDKTEEKAENNGDIISILPLYAGTYSSCDEENSEVEVQKNVEEGSLAELVSDQNQVINAGIQGSQEPVTGAVGDEISTDLEGYDAKKLDIEKEEQNEKGHLVEAVASGKNRGFEVVEQSVIINADMSDRIWVNAGPGTGKTYTVIQRIVRLLDEPLEGVILVLCFSKNAVQVIRERLKAELGFRVESLIDDGTLIIKTFDSFATYMLEEELDPSWDYDRRIEEFIRMLGRNQGELDKMTAYMIADEIQDIVGVRARMLLAIIDELSCGVLLLGDYCQAIFDWTVSESRDMTFVKLAGELGKRNFKQYELSGNQRQERELAQKSQELRNIMLSGTEEMQEKAIQSFKEWAKKNWGSHNVNSMIHNLTGSDELILCKTNGEAAHISQKLFDNSLMVPHVMRQSTNHRTLAPWIAETLSGNDGCIFSRDSFLQNASDYKVIDPDEKWRILKAMDKHEHAPGLHIPEVLHTLSENDSLPEECLNPTGNGVIVSTVHRAKGSEASHVYWLDSPLVYEKYQNNEESLGDALKAAYVAATRAKKDVQLVDPGLNYMKSINDKRWIRTGLAKISKRPFCSGIALLPEDVDEESFVSNGDADSIQAVLAGLEPGLPVDLYLNEMGRYDIYFDGIKIGQTSVDLKRDLKAGFKATNHSSNFPMRITGAFITAITTVISKGSEKVEDKYRIAGCWLGIELGGFPKIEWL